MNLLCSLFNPQPQHLEQVESWFSLVFTDNYKYYYKYCPVSSQRVRLFMLQGKKSNLLIFPCNCLELIIPSKKVLPLFVFSKQQHRLSDLTKDEQKSCLFYIATGI